MQKMNNTNTNAIVSIPSATLNALKNLLFSSETGTDLSTIVDDLTRDPKDRDLTAINVALTFKGVQVDVDKTTKYEYRWKNKISKYEFYGHSLILGLIKAKESVCIIDESGDLVVERVESEIKCFDYAVWASMTTNVADVLEKFNK